jgi:HEAT repeat protein
MTADVLGWAAIALGAWALLAVALWLSHAALAAAHERRRRRLEPQALSAIASAVAGGPREPAVIGLLRLDSESRADVAFGMAEALSGAQRDRFDEVAVDCGLLDGAARLAAGRIWSTRLRAARLATAFGRGEEPFMERLLEDSSPDVRAQAARWAANHPTGHRIEALVAMLADTEPLCRFVAGESVSRIGGAARPAVRAGLAQAGDDREGTLALIEIAVPISDPGFEPFARRLASSADATVRAAAARLLAAIASPEAAETLSSLLADPDPGVRVAAARGAGRGGAWKEAAALAPLLGDENWTVRDAAARALERLGPTGRLLLRRAARGGDPLASRVLDESDVLHRRRLAA